MRKLKIDSLPTANTWVDMDIVMLHACFQMFADFVEKEDGLNHVNYEYYKEIIDELSVLYKWWQVRKKTIHSELKNDDEDQEMLERLIKHRQFLWT